MTLDRLKAAVDAVPFRPFSLRLADGDVVAIRSPYQIAFLPPGRTILVDQPDESFDVIDLLLVTKLSYRKGQRRRRGMNGNGSPRK